MNREFWNISGAVRVNFPGRLRLEFLHFLMGTGKVNQKKSKKKNLKALKYFLSKSKAIFLECLF